MYPPGPRTTSRSPDRNPIWPSVTMEYSSSRVWVCGVTSAPTGNGCSTIASAPPVSRPDSLNTTPIVPRLRCAPPGCTTVSGEASVLPTMEPLLSFWTWNSLCAGQGPSGQEAVQVMAGAVLATVAVPHAGAGVAAGGSLRPGPRGSRLPSIGGGGKRAVVAAVVGHEPARPAAVCEPAVPVLARVPGGLDHRVQRHVLGHDQASHRLPPSLTARPFCQLIVGSLPGQTSGARI